MLPLRAVCQRITSGGTPSRRCSEFYESGSIPWVKTKELDDTWIRDTEEHITTDALNSSSAKLLPENTVLIAMYGATVAQLGILARPMACNQASCALIADERGAHFRYLFYLLLSHREMIKSLSTGAAQQNLSAKQIKEFTFRFPPVQEQRAIAHILGTLDDKIETLRRMNETLEGIARALFKAWFVDFDPVRAKMSGRWRRDQSLPGMPARLYDLFPDKLAPSELGEIPAGWRVSTIGEEVTVLGGATPSTKEPRYWQNGTHFFATPKDLSKRSSPILLETERKVTDDGLAKISSGLLPPGTVLLSSRAPVGYLAVTRVPVCINQGFIAMIPDKTLSSLFVLFWAKTNMAKIKARASGTTFAEISKKNFRPILLTVPSASVLDAFNGLIEPIFEKIATNLEQTRPLAALRDALLPQLISGRLRVRDAEKIIKKRGL